MKKIFISSSLILILGFFSCKKEINTPETKQEEVTGKPPSPPPAPSILQWKKCLGTSAEEFGTAIAKTADGYFVAGYTIDANGNRDATVVKINLSGEVQGQANIGGSKSDELFGVVPTPDGGCLVAGNTSSIDGDLTGETKGGGDVLVCKISPSCNKEWVKTFGGSGGERAFTLINTIDGGFALAGSTTSTDGDVTNSQVQNGISIVWLVKFNITTGLPLIEWQKTFGTPDTKDDLAYALTQGAGGGYTIAARTLTQSYNNQIWVINTNNLGTVNWENRVDSDGADVAFGITASTDINNNINGYVLTGYMSSVLAVVKLNLDGSVNWQKTFPAIGGQGRSVVSTPQGDIIVGRNNDLFILRLDDANGNLISSNIFGGAKDDGGLSVITTADGGYITAGNTSSTNGDVTGNHGKSDMWVLKFKY